MWVLGLNGPPVGWHDAAACITDGTAKVWAMSEEERLIRDKHALHSYPRRSTQLCLDAVGLQPKDIDVVAIGWDLPRDVPQFGRHLGVRLSPTVPGRGAGVDLPREGVP